MPGWVGLGAAAVGVTIGEDEFQGGRNCEVAVESEIVEACDGTRTQTQ